MEMATRRALVEEEEEEENEDAASCLFGAEEQGDGEEGVGDSARVRLRGSSTAVAMFSQQGWKGVNQDAMTVWEVIINFNKFIRISIILLFFSYYYLTKKEIMMKLVLHIYALC